MILKPEDLTQTHEKWLKQLLNMNKSQFVTLCHGSKKKLYFAHNTLFELGAAETERLLESGEGHSEKECMIRDLDRIVRYFIDGQPQENYILAHDYSIFNREQLKQSKRCGCFDCVKIFDPSEIVEWCDLDEDTALCPYCGIDSVLGDASGFEITGELLQQMHDYWFSVKALD